MSLERDLVATILEDAAALNVFVAPVGQYKAKHSGTYVGFPDLVVMASGKIALVELKRTKDAENPAGCLNLGQEAFIAKAADFGIKVHVVDSEQQFVQIVNDMRRPTWVR